MFVFELPEIGEGVLEGEIVRWLVAQGQVVEKDQPLCEIMTDKATVEISSPVTGEVARLHGAEGDIVHVHSPLAEIRVDAEDPVVVAAPSKEAAAPVAAPAVAAPVRPPAPAPPRVDRKTLATPAVRSHARQQGVDLQRVSGSGKDGRVMREDIDAVAQHPAHIKAPPAVQVAAPSGEDRRVPIIGLRRRIAQKMVESYRTVPHFTYVDELDATRLVSLRQALRPVVQAQGADLSYLPFIMKALVQVFRDFPTVNAVMDEDAFTLVVRSRVNIGVAVDTPAGLYVPVVKDVQDKSVVQLSRELTHLSQRTRDNQLTLSELQGGSFTITSVGNIGGRFATPIINHPEVAILGVNQIHDRPVVVDGQVVVRKMMYLSPSFDHRVIDGAVGARFVSALKAVLEQPERLLLDLP